jgi:hypothetical protein
MPRPEVMMWIGLAAFAFVVALAGATQT